MGDDDLRELEENIRSSSGRSWRPSADSKAIRRRSTTARSARRTSGCGPSRWADPTTPSPARWRRSSTGWRRRSSSWATTPGPGTHDKLRDDVALEALNLAAAFIDADGRHTDDELRAFADVFAPRSETVARAASPKALRAAGLLTGKRTFVDAPSPLFDLLVQADARAGTADSWAYYLAAADIAFAVIAIDDDPSHAELTAVEQFRHRLLRAMDGAGVGRPGRPRAGLQGPSEWRPPADRSAEPAAEAEAEPPSRRPRSRPVPSRRCWPSSTPWSGWRR